MTHESFMVKFVSPSRGSGKQPCQKKKKN